MYSNGMRDCVDCGLPEWPAFLVENICRHCRTLRRNREDVEEEDAEEVSLDRPCLSCGLANGDHLEGCEEGIEEEAVLPAEEVLEALYERFLGGEMSVVEIEQLERDVEEWLHIRSEIVLDNLLSWPLEAQLKDLLRR